MAGGLRSLPAFQPTVFLYVKSQKKREAIKPGIHLIRYIIDGYFRSIFNVNNKKRGANRDMLN